MNPNNPSSGTSRRTILVTLAAAPALPQLLLPIRAQAQAQPTPSSTTLDARQFSAAPHAGTDADPWPGSAIVAALKALPSTGGTVMVADGIWQIDTQLHVTGVNNFNLVGQSLNARLMFTGAGQMWFGSVAGAPGITISTLTIDASSMPFNSTSVLRVSNAQNSFFKSNSIMGHPNGGIPAVFYEGGVNNQFVDNSITSGPMGASSLQVQALGGTPNSGFVLARNNVDSGGLITIGLSDVQIVDNYIHNTTVGNSIGIVVCGSWGGTVTNIKIDGNTVDATVGPANGATIAGLPNDPGGASNIDGFAITNNVIKGTGATIAAQSPDPNNYVGDLLLGNNKTHVTISGNQLESAWTGSVIDIRGGGGTVDTVSVVSNVLHNAAGAANLIKQDAHTTNARIINNQGT